MPLHGKIVVIKRSGGDGTEFPLTAACLFGRKPECDIRIQLPQVSKEHCRIELNENKEVILTNLSVVNPTLINGKPMKQSERLKHGDLITIIDRSFRFEYPPEPTPKKSGPPAKRKSETLQVLQEHQVRDPGALVSGEKGTYSQASEQPFLKDGTNAVQSSVGDCDEGARKEAFSTGLRESKSDEEAALSPFGELYQITKQSLSAKLPQKAEQLGTPLSRRDSEKKATTMDAAPQNKASDKPLDCACRTNVTPKSGRRSMNLRTSEKNELACKTNGVLASPAQQVEGASQQGMTPGPATPKKGRRSLKSPAKQQEVSVVSRNVTPVSQKKNQLSKHQESTPGAVAQQVFSQGNSVVEDCTIIKTETTKRNKGACSLTPLNPNVAVVHGGECGPQSPACFVCTPNQTEKKYRESIEDEVKSPKTKALATVRTSPRTTAGKRQASKVLETAVPSCGTNEGAQSKKRKNEDLEGDLLVPMLKRKRVSFGGQLSPELFDKRLPPNSPLRKGATPGRRSLSVLKKHSVLRRASVIGLIQELPSEQSNSKKQKALGSPRKSASTTGSASKTTPPAKKSPTTKHRTPSPGQLKYTMKKPGTPSKQTEAKKSLGPKSPSAAISQSPGRRRSSFNKTPLASEDFKSPIFQSQSPVSAETDSQLKSSFADAVLPPKTPTHEKKSPSAETMSLNASPGQTPIVRGRFSISRIETPSPVTDSNTTAPESSASVTPSIPLRRASLKSAKKTPKSTRSAFEVIRSRRSGAFQPNLKVVSSWADIVKFGNTKAQAEVASKKWITRKAVKIIKQKQKPPKTPVQKIKGHFSTGHAESPATFVVGKAHAKGVKPTGCAPKLVRNTALMKKNVNANEDFTGIAQIFSTPESTRQKRTDGKIHSLNTPQDVPISEISVMNTPEETGEMVVSPLSVVSSAKQGRYHNEAVIRLLKDDQDCTFMCSDSIQQETSLDVRHVQEESQQLVVLESMGKTPKQKSEPAMPLTGVKRLMRTPKRLMEQEDLTGVKRLLKTPKQQKVSEESLIGVKELLRTPKVEGQPVEDAFGVQRMMKTPKVKAVPQSCLTGVKQLVRTPKRKNEPVEDVVGLKRLMRTPKQKSEPVEDMVGLKRLMRTPKQKSEPVEDMVGLKRLMRTPKQKSQPVEDMVGLKRLMRTPKQKSQPVEDMVGLKRLMRTPKQKSQPVEDMVGLKRLLRTPKQKGKSVENKFGLVKLMNSPRQRGATAVEDYTGLQELLQEPDDSLVTRTSSKCDTSQEVTVCASPSSSVIAEIFTAEANAGSEERLELSYFQSNISKKGPKEVDTSAKENKSADAKCDPAIRGPEPNDSEVKRGKPAHGLLAPDREDACSSTVTLPVKAARGRRAKPLHGVAKSKVDENLIRSKADELKECQETINAEQEITVQSAQVEPSVKARRGRKAAVLPKNALAPVRKAGRGRMAKQADDKDVDVKTPIEMGSAETVLVSSTKAVGAHDQELVLPPPVTKPRRGKKAKSDEKDGTSRASLEANVSTKDTDSATDTEQPACPVVKSVRGRKPKTPVKEVNKVVPGELPSRRTRGAAAADSTTTITTTVYSSKPGPERNVLDSQEETMGQKLIQPNASSPETGMKPVRKTRGSRKNQNLGAAAVSACVAIDLPPKDESTHLSNEGRPVLRVVIENKTTTKRGKAAPQSETNKADESEVVEEKLAIKAEVKKGVSKRTVKWNLENVDREDVAELPSSKKRSIVTCVEIVDVPAKQDTELVTKTRRGRPPKKPTFDFSEPPVSDHHDITECAEMTPLRKRRVKSSVQHAAMDVVAPKQGTKQKAACQDTLDDGSEKSSVESPSRPSAVRRARGKAARLEEKVEASVARGQRGLVKKAAEGCHEVETPKPVGRGRKRVVRDMEPEPVSQEKRSSKRNVGIKALSADDSFAKCATRGTKSEASGVAKAKPVRHTRKK